MEVLVVPTERAGMELDEFLCLERPLLNKGFFRRAVRDSHVTVDGASVLPNHRVRDGEVILIMMDELEELGLLPRTPAAPEVPIVVLHEDDQLLVVDKPSGVSSEPERWAPEVGCMAGALLEFALQRGTGRLDWRPRLLHRLDKGTSGVLVAAKDLDTERLMRAAFETGDVHKTYLAIVEGEWPDSEESIIDAAIGEAADLSKKERRRLGGRNKAGRMAVLPGDKKGAKPSRTRVRALERYRGFTLMECVPETGRTHQIRVHLSHAGFPLAVDPIYGRRDELLLSELKRGYRPKPGRPERPLLGRLSLHAAAIDLPDPARNDESPGRLRVEAPMPEDFQRIIRQLAKVRPTKR